MAGSDTPVAKYRDTQEWLGRTYAEVLGLPKDSDITYIVRRLIKEALKDPERHQELMTKAAQLFLGITDEQVARRHATDWLHKFLPFLVAHPQAFLSLIKPGHFFWNFKPGRRTFSIRVYPGEYLYIASRVAPNLKKLLKATKS